MRTWWLDELAHAGAEHLDEAYVAGYDRKCGTDPVDDVAVLRAHGLPDDATVVDRSYVRSAYGAYTCRQR